MKSRLVKRQWADAIEKVESEGCCRVCGDLSYVDAAHTIGRQYDAVVVGPRGGKVLYVEPDSVVPLCGSFSENNHHGDYDAHRLDLTDYLTEEEYYYAVGIVGEERTVRRIAGRND